jgi:hypothetical protein
MSAARPVRIPQRPSPSEARGGGRLDGPEAMPAAGATPAEHRPNAGASRRAWRLALLFVVAVAAVYGLLADLARVGPAGGSGGALTDLGVVGIVAAAVACAGAVVALGAAPREVILSEAETVVVGRFGRRYVFPGRAQLRAVVLRRTPAGWLSPNAIETVEIYGGSSRRTFALDEGIVATTGRPSEPAG